MVQALREYIRAFYLFNIKIDTIGRLVIFTILLTIIVKFGKISHSLHC
jgi:hypothetical protein